MNLWTLGPFLIRFLRQFNGTFTKVGFHYVITENQVHACYLGDEVFKDDSKIAITTLFQYKMKLQQFCRQL